MLIVVCRRRETIQRNCRSSCSPVNRAGAADRPGSSAVAADRPLTLCPRSRGKGSARSRGSRSDARTGSRYLPRVETSGRASGSRNWARCRCTRQPELPVGDDVEITLDVLQNFKTHDRVIWLLIALRTPCIADEKAVLAPGPRAGHPHPDFRKVEPAVLSGQGLHEAVGKCSSAASYFQYPSARQGRQFVTNPAIEPMLN